MLFPTFYSVIKVRKWDITYTQKISQQQRPRNMMYNFNVVIQNALVKSIYCNLLCWFYEHFNLIHFFNILTNCSGYYSINDQRNINMKKCLKKKGKIIVRCNITEDLVSIIFTFMHQKVHMSKFLLMIYFASDHTIDRLVGKVGHYKSNGRY